MNPFIQMIMILGLAAMSVQAKAPATGPTRIDSRWLSQLRAEAAHAYPSARAATLRSLATANDLRAIRLWDDPMVGLGFMGAEKMMREADGDIMIGVEQALPKPGMFAAQQRKGRAMHAAEMANAEEAARSAATTATRNAIELALADEAILLERAQVNWLKTIAENARQAAADPMATNTDALRLATEFAKEQQLLDAAVRKRLALAQQLNLSLGRALDSPWPQLRLPESPSPVPVAAAEIARISHANPKLRAMRAMAAAAAAETRIADRESLPQFSVGVDTAIYSGDGFRSSTVGLKMNLPWFNERSYQEKIAAARHREQAAALDIDAMHRDVAAMVLDAATEAANAGAQAHAYKAEIRDHARQARNNVEAAWISSKATLTDLLDAPMDQERPTRTLHDLRHGTHPAARGRHEFSWS